MASIIYNKGKTMLSSLKNCIKQAESVDTLNLFVHAVDKEDTGCSFAMLNTNYAQVKTKILKTDDGRIMRDNSKLVILNVFNSLKEVYNRNTKFRFSVRALSDYLNGADTKIIQTFKINKLGYAFGIYKPKSSYVSFKFINTFLESGILKKGKNGNYENLDFDSDSVSDYLVI